jgi:uncharacterized membrane protein HdeD (DUF308 family)
MQSGAISLFLQVPAEVTRNWGWFLAFGIGLVILGVLGVFQAVRATVVSMYFFGWLLVLAGAIEIVHAFMVGNWSGFFLHLLVGILFGVIGFLLLTKPIISAEAITFVLAMFFIVTGIYEIVAPLVVHMQGSGWWVLNGIVSVLLGSFVLAQWPATGLWVIGLYIGIQMITHGLSWIGFSMGLHKL